MKKPNTLQHKCVRLPALVANRDIEEMSPIFLNLVLITFSSKVPAGRAKPKSTPHTDAEPRCRRRSTTAGTGHGDAIQIKLACVRSIRGDDFVGTTFSGFNAISFFLYCYHILPAMTFWRYHSESLCFYRVVTIIEILPEGL